VKLLLAENAMLSTAMTAITNKIMPIAMPDWDDKRGEVFMAATLRGEG
jgi:hypothetical protein